MFTTAGVSGEEVSLDMLTRDIILKQAGLKQ
jgi:hypothetical protein